VDFSFWNLLLGDFAYKRQIRVGEVAHIEYEISIAFCKMD